jgi:hypothetical protein
VSDGQNATRFPTRTKTNLQTQGHVEVLRHVRLGPDLLLVIVAGVLERRVLERRPAEKGIMSDKRRDFAIRAGHGDTLVDAAGKVRDTVLKIVMGNLHDIYHKF